MYILLLPHPHTVMYAGLGVDNFFKVGEAEDCTWSVCEDFCMTTPTFTRPRPIFCQ